MYFIDMLGFCDCGVHVLNIATEHFSLLIFLFNQLSSFFLKKKPRLFQSLTITYFKLCFAINLVDSVPSD